VSECLSSPLPPSPPTRLLFVPLTLLTSKQTLARHFCRMACPISGEGAFLKILKALRRDSTQIANRESAKYHASNPAPRTGQGNKGQLRRDECRDWLPWEPTVAQLLDKTTVISNVPLTDVGVLRALLVLPPPDRGERFAWDFAKGGSIRKTRAPKGRAPVVPAHGLNWIPVCSGYILCGDNHPTSQTGGVFEGC
jgi:hypothetical protein